MVDERHQADIVEDAFAALRQSQPPQGPSVQALVQTLRAVHQAQSEPLRTSLFERIRRRNRLIKYPVGLAAAAVLLVLAAWCFFTLRTNEGGKVSLNNQTPSSGQSPATVTASRPATFKASRAEGPRGFSEGLAARRDESTGKVGFIDVTGRWAIPPSFDYNMTTFRDGLALVEVNLPGPPDKYGEVGFDRFFIDRTGQKVSIPHTDAQGQEFRFCTTFSEGLAVIYQDDRYGYADRQGRVVIRPQYRSAEPFSEGLARVGRLPDAAAPGSIAYIDPSGKTVLAPDGLKQCESFHEGLAPARKQENSKWGYIGRDGKFVIEAQFQEASGFSEGLAAVAVDFKWGYINRAGQAVVPPQYLSARPFREGLAAVLTGKDGAEESQRWGFIDASGKMVILNQFSPYCLEDFAEGMAHVLLPFRDGPKGYIGHDGQFVIADAAKRHVGQPLPALEPLGLKPTGEIAAGTGVKAPQMGDFCLDSFVFSEGLAAVPGWNGRTYQTGYLDRSGKWFIEPQFSMAGRFSQGIARVQANTNGKTEIFYIDRSGNRVDGSQVASRQAVLQVFESGGKYGYKNASTGKVAIEAQWDEAAPFSEGMACVKLFNAGGSRYIDETGRVVIPPDNFSGRDFHNGLAVATKKGSGRYGFIDHSGRFVIEPKFSEADAFSEGLAHVQLDGRHGFVDTAGNLVIPLKFREARRFTEGLAAFRVEPPAGQEHPADSEGDWGYIDRTGKVVIPAQFRKAGPFSEGLAAVMRDDGTLSFIDVTGKDVIQLAAGRGKGDQ